MSDTTDKGARFAELALELFGAKAANEFVREVWASASPEVKQALADTVIVQLRSHLVDGSASTRWALDRAIESHAQQVVGDALRDRADEFARIVRAAIGDIAARVEREVGQYAEKAVREYAKNAAQTAIRAAVEQWPKR